MMNSKLKVFACIALSTLAVIACKKDDPAPIVTPPKVNSMEAKIGNKPWVANDVVAYTFENRLVVKGVAKDGRTLTINLNGSAIGEYKLNALSLSEAMVKDSNFTSIRFYDSKVDGGYTGTVNITSFDATTRTLSLNFNFVLRSLTDGKLLAVENGEVSNVPVSVFNPVVEKVALSSYSGIFKSGPDTLLVYDTVDTQVGVAYRGSDRIFVEFPFRTGNLQFSIQQDIEAGVANFTEGEVVVKFIYGSTTNLGLGEFKVINHDKDSRILTGTYLSAEKFINSPNTPHNFTIKYPEAYVFNPY